jgi:hypothetical protein
VGKENRRKHASSIAEIEQRHDAGPHAGGASLRVRVVSTKPGLLHESAEKGDSLTPDQDPQKLPFDVHPRTSNLAEQSRFTAGSKEVVLIV